MDITGKLVVEFRERKHFIYYNGKKTKYQISTLGKVYNSKSGEEVKQCYSSKDKSNSYKKVHLKDYTAKLDKRFLVHRLVAQSFINNPKNKPQVNHKDGNKSKNYLYNLEWMTVSKNSLHAIQNGLSKYNGETNGNSKYTDEQIEQVCQLLQEGKLSNKKIAKETGVSKEMVSMIKIGKVRNFQSNKYHWDRISFNEMKGDNHPSKLIDSKTARYICELLQSKQYTPRQITAMIGLDPKEKDHIVNNIKARKSWKDISKDYEW